MNRAAAKSLAVWLLKTHPPLFAALSVQAQRARVRGLGRLGDGETTLFDTGSTFAPDIAADMTPNLAPISFAEPDLQSLTFDSSSLAVPDYSMASQDQLPIATDSGGGFFSSVGSALSSAVAGVGSFLTSTQGLSSLTNLASTYFKAQATSDVARTQAAVLQSQVARAANGQVAAPIGYTRNPYTGALTPVLQTANGYAPLNVAGTALPAGLSNFVSQYGLWLVLGLIGVSVVLSVSRRSS